MKTKKTYYFSILLGVLVALGVYFYQKANRAIAPVNETEKKQLDENSKEPALNEPIVVPNNQATTTSANQPKPAPQPDSSSKPVFSDGSEMEGLGPDVLVTQVDYNGAKFSPAQLNIKVGDIVIFKNTGASDFWPASDPHPTHTAYPEFDAKKAVPAGGSFQFKFLNAGSWGYHDHFNPTIKGVVNVAR